MSKGKIAVTFFVTFSGSCFANVRNEKGCATNIIPFFASKKWWYDNGQSVLFTALATIFPDEVLNETNC